MLKPIFGLRMPLAVCLGVCAAMVASNVYAQDGAPGTSQTVPAEISGETQPSQPLDPVPAEQTAPVEEPAEPAVETATGIQNGQFTGKIVDETGRPVAFATVSVKGTIRGSITEADGSFTTNASTGDVLNISFTGYTPRELELGIDLVLGDIVLKEDMTVIDNVVVTALGIERSEKALTYNVQQVDGSEITRNSNANFLNSLAGKVAGVQINTSASGAGGSVRVVMRGPKNINSDNNALFVVDGIPMPILRTAQTSQIHESPDGGDTDGMADLNPEDIESTTVLTGASAAALYGSKGANGVVLITTKRGGNDGLNVSFTNKTTFSAPFILPEFQNTYGSTPGSRMSWGNKLDKPTSYDPADFFQTAYDITNAASVSYGTERQSMYVSLGSLNSRGIIPNSKYNRYNLTTAYKAELVKDKLLLDVNFNYISQDEQNRTIQGMQVNPLVPIYLFPRGDDIRKYQVYERYAADRNIMTQFWPNEDEINDSNPWWITNRMLSNVDKDRYIFFASGKWNIIKGLTLVGRIRMDNTDRKFTRRYYASSNLKYASLTGNYMFLESKTKALYADAILNYKWTKDRFLIDVNIGGSIDDVRSTQSGHEANLGNVPNHFYAGNMDYSSREATTLAGGYHDQVQALFATAQFGVWSGLYVDLTGRFEWSSMLNGAEKPYLFYPSVGLSGVITDWVDLRTSGVSLLKVRASYAEVGASPMRYVTGAKRYPYNGAIPSNRPQIMPAPYLKPERTRSFEAGVNAVFWNGRLTVDFTYYNTNTFNQIFQLPGAESDPFDYFMFNAGKVNNWGIEAALGSNNRFGEFEWATNLTFTMNRNKIVELIPEGTIDPIKKTPMAQRNTVNIISDPSFQINMVKGGTMSDIYVKTLDKDHHGYVKVDPMLLTVSATNTDWVKAGSSAPDAELGWSNSLRYKGFDLSLLITARFGGVVVSPTQALMDRYGVSKASADARDAGGAVVNGGKIDARGYYAVAGGGTTGVLGQYVYSATNVRLKEVSLAYTFPNKWFKDKIKNLTLAVNGTNLLMIYKRAPFDPEMTASTSTFFQGIDYFMQPSVRSVGFSVKLQF